MTAIAKSDFSAIDFGVGSFSFETFPAGEENDNEWEDRVRALLESLPTVRDIEFSGIDCFRASPSAIEGDWESDGVLLTPHPWSGKLSFHIAIPARIQRELAEQAGGGPIFEDHESFFVLTYFSDFPVTYVFVEGEAEKQSYGSQAVVIVRKFLDGETERYRDDDSIRFTFIGPSPIHCDFALSPSEDQMPAPFKLQRIPREGGDSVAITYDSTVYTSAFAAIPTVTRRMAGELSYFYESVRKRERRMRAVLHLRQEVERLINMTMQRGLGGSIIRFFKSRRLIRDLSLSLIVADYECRQEEQSGKSGFENLSERFSGLFRKEIDTETKSSSGPEIENLNDIVQLVSSRQKRGVDMTMLLITSLLGGIIGSILTVIFTGSH
jgi:hypothetical protein